MGDRRVPSYLLRRYDWRCRGRNASDPLELKRIEQEIRTRSNASLKSTMLRK